MLVPVAMVQIGVVRVLVAHRFVLMPVRVRLGHGAIVVMLVVLVVNMTVLMRHRFVKMLVIVPFGEMEPESQSHQQRRQDQFECQWLAEG